MGEIAPWIGASPVGSTDASGSVDGVSCEGSLDPIEKPHALTDSNNMVQVARETARDVDRVKVTS